MRQSTLKTIILFSFFSFILNESEDSHYFSIDGSACNHTELSQFLPSELSMPNSISYYRYYYNATGRAWNETISLTYELPLLISMIQRKNSNDTLVKDFNMTLTGGNERSIYYHSLLSTRPVDESLLNCQLLDDGILVNVSSGIQSETFEKIANLAKFNMVLVKGKPGIFIMRLINNTVQPLESISKYIENKTTAKKIEGMSFINLFDTPKRFNQAFAVSNTTVFYLEFNISNIIFDELDFSKARVTLPLTKLIKAQRDSTGYTLAFDGYFGIAIVNKTKDGDIKVTKIPSLVEHQTTKQIVSFAIKDALLFENISTLITDIGTVKFENGKFVGHHAHSKLQKIDMTEAYHGPVIGIQADNAGHEFFIEASYHPINTSQLQLHKAFFSKSKISLTSASAILAGQRVTYFFDVANDTMLIIRRAFEYFIPVVDYKISLSDYGIKLEEGFQVFTILQANSTYQPLVLVIKNTRYIISIDDPIRRKTRYSCNMTTSESYILGSFFLNNLGDNWKRIERIEYYYLFPGENTYTWMVFLALGIIFLIGIAIGYVIYRRKRIENQPLL